MAKVKSNKMTIDDALVPVEEQSYEVYENWIWTRIGAVAKFERGITFPASAKEKVKKEDNIPCLRTANIQEKLETSDMIYVNKSYLKSNQKKLVRKDDIIMSSANSRELVGKVSYVHDLPYPMTFGGFVLGIRAKMIKPLFLFYYLRYEFLCGNFMGESTQTTNIANINTTTLSNYIIPLPPESEQQRIVEQIEKLFSKLEEAKEKAQDSLDSFRERDLAILHKAFDGSLTRKWRQENKIDFASWENIEWGKVIKNIEAGKNWSALGRPPINNEFGVVKVSSVTWGEFNELESKTCQIEEQWNEKNQIKQGDFLFSRANTLQLVGNCVIVKRISKRLMLSDKILRFSFDNTVLPEYILYFTRSDLYREQVEKLASGNQDGMRNISQKNVKLINVPIPLMEEQREIVSIIESIKEKERQVENVVEQIIDRIEQIKKSILAKAFRGGLGTNDPSEESAIELLKQIIERG